MTELSNTEQSDIDRRFWNVWWTCGCCHASFPKDYAPDYCDDCNVRLRRNDDVRLALMGAL